MTPTQVANSGADPRLDALRACGAALRRESHLLRERPELTWQQLYNLLQWEEGSVTGEIEPQAQRRSAPGASPWLHVLTRSRESDALSLVLTGHTDDVFACAISPDSSYIVTASADNTARVWDAATGRERAVLTGHTDSVVACAVSPDSSYTVTAGYDHTARIWDAATGRERAILPLLARGERAALQPWRPSAVCGDQGGNVYLFDLVGIEYGPIAVTAVGLGKGDAPAIRCPKCSQLHRLNEAWLGEVIECPTPRCDLSLRVNSLVARMPERGHWWSRN